MKFRHAVSGGDEKIELQMVPMIDIVFQLLIFFVMTFKIAVPEGDFSITMPIHAPINEQPEDLQLPIHVHLVADASGNLKDVRVNRQDSYGSGKAAFNKLRSRIIEEVNKGPVTEGSSSFAEAGEVEFEADFHLKYKYIIHAVTAVTGHKNDEGQIVKLMHKIKFVPQEK